MNKNINTNIFKCKIITKFNNNRKTEIETQKENYKNMNFINKQSVKREHKMLLNGHLVVIQLNAHQLNFTVFRQSEENMLWKGRLGEDEISGENGDDEDDSLNVGDVFEMTKRHPQECINEQGMHHDKLIMKLKVNNKNKQLNTIQKSISLQSSQITLQQTLKYTRQLYQAKQQISKQQILKLKSTIYQLMTQLQDATSLIKSQSQQAKHHREETKELRQQLQKLKIENNMNNNNISVRTEYNNKNGRQQIGIQSQLSIQTQKVIVSKNNKRESSIRKNDKKTEEKNDEYRVNKPISGLLIEHNVNNGQINNLRQTRTLKSLSKRNSVRKNTSTQLLTKNNTNNNGNKISQQNTNKQNIPSTNSVSKL